MAAPAWAACSVEPRATVPVERAMGVPMVTLEVNGGPVRVAVDTGAERSVLSLAAADRLHLQRDEWVSTDMQGAGGRDRRRLGRPQSLTLDGIALRRHTVAADNSIVVGPLANGLDGLLGQDYLSAFDLDLDAEAGQLTLSAVSGCSGRFLPWTTPYVAIPAWRPVRNVLAVPIHLGAATLMAVVDTGAAQTAITLPGMVQLHLAAGGTGAIGGFGAGTVAARTEHFPAVRVGIGPTAPMDLVIAPLHTMISLGALLGSDWLASHHVWISWATDQIFVALP